MCGLADDFDTMPTEPTRMFVNVTYGNCTVDFRYMHPQGNVGSCHLSSGQPSSLELLVTMKMEESYCWLYVEAGWRAQRKMATVKYFNLSVQTIGEAPCLYTRSLLSDDWAHLGNLIG